MLKKVIGKVQRVQIDIMDSVFVPNISLNFDFQLIKGITYEAHLMMKKPLEWIEKNADKVNIVIIHVESLKNIEAAIDFIKNIGLKVYLATKPETKNEVIIPYIKDIDGLLIMTVEPGSYCLEKKFLSSFLMLLSVLGISTPSFLLAMLFWAIYINVHRTFGIKALPSVGFGLDLHILMPVLVLEMRPLVQIAQVSYVTLSDVLRQDYIRTAKAKGLSWR